MGAHRPSARASSLPVPSAPSLTRTGLRLGDQVVPLLCGAVHYFRMPPARWRRALESIRWLGLELVETYVPWGVHELAEGRFDFGEHDPRNDLGGFLDLAHELGLAVFLRPGPNVNAELPFFGLPRRVVLDERNQARSPGGHVLPFVAPPRMFPVPSYASRAFRAQVERWYAAVAEVVAPRRWPQGAVALLQVDNEVAFFFRDAPYDSDYHPDALADFARFLEQRHGSIAALNAAYGTKHATFEQVPAPRRLDARAPRPLPPCLDWMRFHEALLCESVAELAASMTRAGLAQLPLVHNQAMGEGGLPATISALGRSVDLVGLDYYHRRSGAEHARKRTLRLAGSTRLPFAPELGVGAPPWFAPRSELDSLLGALWACAYGLRGFNLYMAVEREQWYGAPIDADGEPRAHAERWRRLIAALRDVEFHRLVRRVEVGLSIPKEYAQLSRATHMLGALSPSLLDLSGLPPSSACRADRFGFEQPIQLAWEPLLAQVDEALCAAHVPFVYVEGEAELDPVEGPRVLFAPSFEFADPERWQRLHQFAERGGSVIWGPKLPSLDLDLRPCEFRPLPGPGPWQPRDPADADTQVRELCRELGLQRPFAAFPRPLGVSVHEDPDGGGPRAVFVLNPSALPVHGELRVPRALGCADALTGERFEIAEATALPMPAWGCRMLIVETSAT